MKLQKVLINILLCLCLEIVVSICGNVETDDKGERTLETSEYPYTTDKQTTVLLETDVNTVNTIASEVKEAELTKVQYKNEIKVRQNVDKDIEKEAVTGSAESHGIANIGEYYLKLYLEEEMKRIKNDWT